ncbi:MAG: hypothetical protein ACYDHZ_00760 [Dehalococcoidia bacterium]
MTINSRLNGHGVNIIGWTTLGLLIITNLAVGARWTGIVDQEIANQSCQINNLSAKVDYLQQLMVNK